MRAVACHSDPAPPYPGVMLNALVARTEVHRAMRRDPATLLLTALAVASLSVRTVAGRPYLLAAPRARLGRAPAPARQSEAGTTTGAGHDAATPSEIPGRCWWAIAKRAVSNVSEDGLLTQAAAITFYALLSLFPALAALVSIYGLFANPTTIEGQLKALSGVVPSGGMQLVTDQMNALLTRQ